MGFDDDPADGLTEIELCIVEIQQLQAENARLRDAMQRAIDRLAAGRPSAAWGGLAADLDGHPYPAPPPTTERTSE